MLFDQLSKENCLFFYVLSVISLILFVATIVIGLLKKKRKIMATVLVSLTPLVSYYMYRLLYSMCNNSL